MPISITVFFFVFLLLSLYKVPIAFSMLISSFGFFVIKGLSLYTFIERISSGLYSFPLLAMPFFILAAQIMNSAGITKRIFDFTLVIFGNIRGGLAYVNVVVSMIFAGISGSAMSDVAGLGQIEIQSMIDDGYDPGFSAAITAATCTIGPVIPPSMVMILIGVMSEVSVGRLFAGGLIPGILMGVSMIVYIWFQTKRGKIRVPLANNKGIDREQFKKKLKEGFLALLSPLIILGAILTGIATPTEAGVIAVVYAIFLGVVYKELNFKKFYHLLRGAAYQTGTIMFIVAAAQIFAWIITTERVAIMLYEYILNYFTSDWAILIIINLVLLVVGCFIEGIAAILIVVPILLPIIKDIGIDPIHFGVFLCINIMMGLLTPPIGLAVYVSADLAKVPAMEVFQKAIPFLIPLFIILMLVVFIPQITMFIPNLLF